MLRGFLLLSLLVTLAEKATPIVSALLHHLDFLKNEVLPRSSADWRIGADRFGHKLDLEIARNSPGAPDGLTTTR